MKFTGGLKRKIHELAQQLGIDRRNIAFSGGLDSGNGGSPCSLCDELALGAGLKFADNVKLPARAEQLFKRNSLFESPD